MSTFSGLQTAASGLAAARAGMTVVGQNIANETTPGYTRQRVEQSSVPSAGSAGLWPAAIAPGDGVAVDQIARLGDEVLDARVRDALSASGFWTARATASAQVEAAMAEPTENGLAATMDGFWASWSDLANSPDGSAAAVVLSGADVLVSQIAAGYEQVSASWTDLRGAVDRQVADINATASQVAELNEQIRQATQSGRGANELIDQRNLLAQNLSTAAGVTGSLESDGTMTLRLEGNALVSGGTSREIVASGPVDIDAAGHVAVAWADRPDVAITSLGGELGGMVSVLAPAASGGPLAVAAQGYNDVATSLAEHVNDLHRQGQTRTGAAGGDYFSLNGTGPAAVGLSVAVGGLDDLALARPGSGSLDTSIADEIGTLGDADGGPSKGWAAFVTQFGVSTSGDLQRANIADTGAIAAVSAQQSNASVDVDEETVNLLTYQTAYQASARVLTAVDEALDTLINRTGLVGR